MEIIRFNFPAFWRADGREGKGMAGERRGDDAKMTQKREQYIVRVGMQ